jgi:replicative DNA helicase
VDLDKAFVAAVLIEGKDVLRSAQARGVKPEILSGEGLEAYKFVVEYVKQYGDTPSFAAVEGKTGVVLDPKPQGAADFFADEVVNRNLHVIQRKWAKEQIDWLEKRDPRKAYEILQSELKELRENGAGGSKVESIPRLFTDVWDYYERIKRGERGVLTPWPTLNEATLGFWPGEIALFVARTGIGKCVHKDTLLVDPVTGVPHTIESLYESPTLRRVSTWSKEGGVHAREITAKHDTGRKECLRFTLKTGRSVVVTPEHPFLTPEGWKRADALMPGSSVGTPARMPFPEEPDVLSHAELDVLSVLLAEGSTSGNHVGFSSSDPVIVDLMIGAADGLDCDVKYRQGVDYDFVGRAYRQNPVLDLVRAHGLEGVRAVEKVLPEAIWRLPKKQLSRFLSLFWMCDGYVDGSGPGVTLGSEKLTRDLQSILLRFGVQSSVDYKQAECEGKKFDAWRLRVYASSYEAFDAAVLLWGEKAKRLKNFVSKARNSNVGFPHVSEATMLEIKAKAGEELGRWTDPERTAKKRRVAERLGRKEFSPKDLFKQHGDLYAVSLEGLRVFVQEFGCEAEYRWLWDSEVFWDEVEDVQSVGDQKIFDLTVEPTSCFVANDVIVHNTWCTIQISHHAWKIDKKKVLFATTEVSKLRIAMRFAALHLKFPYELVRKGKLSAFQEQKFKDALDEIKHAMNTDDLNVVGGEFNFSLEGLEGAIEEAEPDLLIMDGAYLLKSAGTNRIERAANAFDDLKRLAVRKGIPGVVTTQFNREVKANQANSVKTESIALTDVAAWNADMIIGLVQTDDMRRDRRMIMKPLKGREGPAEEFECNWDFDQMRFDELPKAGGPGGGGGGGGGGGPSGDSDDFGTGVDDAPLDDAPF